MKFRSLRQWENLEELAGLAFFAQLLEELLFDYSLDTYKPSAMNSSSLCVEALDLITDIEDEVIDHANLSHVLGELILNLRKDEVVHSLVDFDLEHAHSTMLNKVAPLHEKKVIVELIHSQINLSKYKEKNEELLVDAVNNGREKNRIRSLTRSYVTTIITLGYSTQYLYASSMQTFHRDGQKIGSPDDIRNFFDIAKGNTVEYVAIFKASQIFSEISESCKKFDIKISKSIDHYLEPHVQTKNFRAHGGEVYLVFDKVKALDVYSARESAERLLDRLSALTNIFHHKQVPTWSKVALLVNKESNISRVIPSSRNPMHMCNDKRTKDAADHLYRFIEDFTLGEAYSFQKYSRAVDLHALALKSDSPENQLLNLWVALETITPSKLSGNKAKVNKIIDSTLPFLSLNYIHALTDRLLLDFKLWNREILGEAIDGVSGQTERERLIRILVLAKHDDRKRSLYRSLKDFHLLRNRAHYFSEVLSSTEKIVRVLENNWTRVDWQVRRIYRARNQIVHAGHTPLYINVLIKNIHDYLDVVLGSIANLASREDKINTIDQAYKYTQLLHVEYMNELKGGSVETTEENVHRVIIRRRI